MKILNYTLILLFTFGMLSCSSSGGGSDETAPVVSFNSPSTSASAPTKIVSGATVSFTGTVSDNKELKSIAFSNISGSATKTVNDFITDFNAKLADEKPSSISVLDKETYNVGFSIETLAGAPAATYTMTCTVIDSSDNPTTVTFYITVE
ncbi:DUF4625 domain-containing protein [Ancylomarina sp. 16SWW S1-10-2]|uniref:DUF4625 domain-containing protein n=1 Tax=Ancylomarina sp. 16SWW S1-10-2 TaxID=2499681 RepID=UPI0012ADD38A|nr:DUF4625 domain-containing protein [Ancylomarina sp. 16SWW S1-10-2]MRT94441.1 DUF4625 domain-containing protein [Ancylomarina sp. 16SWW S1-10-2]